MCGIAGFATGRPGSPEGAEAVADAMARALAHRGPDAHCVHAEPDGRLAFGHRRLAIVDLSATGLQPMASADGRWLVCYNGEIYNHTALRAALLQEGVAFRGHSDTEVMLEWIARWGLDAFLDAAEGMFAIALWDRRDGRLTLVRDPFGIKPLYWTLEGDRLGFGSELKALRALPGFVPRIDRAAASAMLRFGAVPAPGCILAGVAMLPPGHVLDWRPGETPALRSYWSAEATVRASAAAPLGGNDDTLIALIEDEIRRSIGQEMIADVPIGCFLSGGVDSSLVTALMRQLAGAPIHSFTVGFDQPGYDESTYAAAVAAHLGTTHHTILVGPKDAAEVLSSLATQFDEPVADMAAIPTHLVSRLARETVTVALSGDGGDELFGGYDRYAQAEALVARLGGLPDKVRQAGAAVLRAAPAPLLNAAGRLLRQPPGRTGSRARRLAQALEAGSRLDVYRSLIELWPDAGGLARHAAGAPGIWTLADADLAGLPGMLPFQLADAHTYLPDVLLAKIDRASMACGLEVRVPLLNHRLAALAWRLPERQKRRDGRGKWLLRQVLARHVPDTLVDRPKQGFGVPMGIWLRGPLRDWAEPLLAAPALEAAGFARPDIVLSRWRSHLAGEADWSHPLWAVLVLQDWWRHWASTPSVT